MIEVDPIEVVIYVPQQQANQLVPGMPVQLATDAIPATLAPGGALVGHVAAIVPNADLSERFQRLWVHVACWFRSRADGLPDIAQPCIDDRFCHLRTAGISST